MGKNLLEVDGARLSVFGGGSANFESYRGPAYQIEDEIGRHVALTPVQALRIASAVFDYHYHTRSKLTEDDRTESAFPANDGDRLLSGGMSLRDWFAGQLMAAAGVNNPSMEEAAQIAYRAADAMLVVRKAVRA